MKAKLSKLYIFVAASLLTLCVSCSDDEKEEQTILRPSSSQIEVNKYGLTATGDTAVIDMYSNKYWTISIQSEEDWLSTNTLGGYNETEIKLNAKRNKSEDSRTGVITFTTLDGTTKTVSVTQKGNKEELFYFKENVDGSPVSSKLSINSYTAWSAEGLSGFGLRLYGEGVYVDNANPSSGYTNASGQNNLFLGENENNPDSKISLYTSAIETKQNRAFTLSFATFSKEASFNKKDFKVYISKDNTYWSELNYERSANAGWEKSEIKFYFDDLHPYLSFRFTANEPNTFRVDDIKLGENEYGVGEHEDFIVVIDDENPIGFVYFEENFDWTKVETNPNRTDGILGLSMPYALPNMLTSNREEVRLDYDNTKNFQYYTGLYDAKVNSGWTVPSTSPRVYVSYGCFKTGTTATGKNKADGILLSSKFSKITKGALVNVKVTFKASIYKNDTGSTDKGSHITVTIPEGSPGTINDMITISKNFTLTQWPPEADEFSFIIYGATSDTRLQFRSPDRGEDETGVIVNSDSRRAYYRYFKVEKIE